MENSRFTFTKIRMELFDFLKFNKDEKAYLFYCISRQLIRYNLKDGKDDIVQIICEGLLIEINKNANIKEYDEITKNITNRKKELMIDIKTNKKLMKIINKEYKILELKKEIRFLGRKISNITSDAYGVRSRKKSDFYNSVSDSDSDSSNNNLKKTRVILPEYDGDLDNNADFDIKTKYIINNYLADLDNTEKVMFEKLYYEGVSYKGMLELDEVKSDYSLRIFVKKTKKYFKEQLLD